MLSLSPNIFVKDIQATIEFYSILGFELTMSVPAENSTDLVWAMLSNGAVNIMLQTYDSLGNDLPQISRKDGGSLLLYINVKNIQAYFDSIQHQVLVLKELNKTFYGATEFAIADINNYVLVFAEHEAGQQ